MLSGSVLESMFNKVWEKHKMNQAVENLESLGNQTKSNQIKTKTNHVANKKRLSVQQRTNPVRTNARLHSEIAFDNLIAGQVSRKQFNSDRVSEFGLSKQYISSFKGFGVRNRKFISRNSIVLVFDGEYRTLEEAKKREFLYAEKKLGSYMLYLQYLLQRQLLGQIINN
jgi:hypothetical protein